MNSEQAKINRTFQSQLYYAFNTTSNYLIFMWPALMAVVLQQVILLAMAVTFSENLKEILS